MIGLSLPPGPLRVVCLAAHPDDVEIACGATLLALAERNAQHGDVSAAWLTMTGTLERAEEGRAAAEAFFPGAISRYAQFADGRLPAHWGEVKDTMEALAKDHPADLIFAPRGDDAHQDHRLVGTLASTVWRDALVLHYEIPKWDGDLRPQTHYVPASPERVARKWQLLNKHYTSQQGRDWWDEETFSAMMRLRGIECHSRYAEAFAVSKAVLSV
ncbi:N-acetylglucosaminyl deacetylase, LmbE family [Sanguibacter gelidistatuariae]|uniref:N-acetylglucosaminyl deacetylase, LmbE family n=1 Tax=Sanguibacter gelidistatuariae TaxID=1814289 RepID=A0A1G6QBV4_9MICO|nr:PIG-L family deacetylase [Sanguibacter gelidistatuariae]SDC89839.1 N-acetylglucosaminyl deacetylase, LmbE family [Sanguibacter gelidistatuariae]